MLRKTIILLYESVRILQSLCQENGCYTQITKLAVDAITNIRTVAMTCSETSFLTLIHQDLQHLYSYSLKKMHWR